MNVIRSGGTLAAAFALSVLLFSSAAHAYTPEQQQACTGDAFRLCGSEIPNIDRITACMIRSRALLSPGCRVYFRSPAPGAASVRMARHPARITPVTVRYPSAGKPRKPKKPGRPAGAT